MKTPKNTITSTPNCFGQVWQCSPVGCLLAALVLLLGWHVQAFDPVVAVDSGRGHPGQETVLRVRTFGVSNVTAVQFDISYDPSHATLTNFVLSNELTNHVLWSYPLTNGQYRMVVFSTNNSAFQTNQPLVHLTFLLPSGERSGSGPVTPSSIVLAREDASSFSPFVARAGTVFVSQVYRNPVNGEIYVFFPSVAGVSYVLQATTDFQSWINLSTNQATSEYIDLVDTDGPSFPYRFYRLADYDALLVGKLEAISQNSDATVSFRATGWEGCCYEIQASTNFVHWSAIGTCVVTNGQLHFQDPDAASYSRRFYRLKLQ